MKKSYKGFPIYALIIIGVLIATQLFSSSFSSQRGKKIEVSELYQYIVMPVGQWIGETEENIPEGMPYSDYQRMAAVWAEVQSTMGSDVATIGRE